MGRPVRRVVIVGGGTAGWLAASLIAARAAGDGATGLDVTLIESPDVPTIGVGEGTWPTMRGTLAAIGIDEADFLIACDASFKQGSRFTGWSTGAAGDSYLHPFTAPVEGDPRDLVRAWAAATAGTGFASLATAQAAVCADDLAPRQTTMPPYAGALNYAYHLDAGRFAAMLAAHATRALGVRHLRDHVIAVEGDGAGGIASVQLREGETVAGDLFVDCTGHAALLIGDTLGVPLVDRGDTLFNDRALAVQLPVSPGSPIASQTDATAHAAGWIWDIGLPGRRGIGCVYASAYMSDDEAADTLDAYLRRVDPDGFGGRPSVRRLAFRSAHRARFWQGNCLAIGLSAGFLEPLEASAIVLVELSVAALLDSFPATDATMTIHADRFNRLFRYRWDRIVEFLKLHYLLSRREEPYWRAHRDPASVPPRLADLLRLWEERPPVPSDFPAADEIFPAASHQYVLYGMGAGPPPPGPVAGREDAGLAGRIRAAADRGRALVATLPGNRAYLDGLWVRAGHPAARAVR